MTIYVGNISYTMSEDDLQNVFSEFGQVASAKIIIDKHSGRSKGYGFVEMTSDAEVEVAVNQLNGKEVNGRNIKVNKAHPKTEE